MKTRYTKSLNRIFVFLGMLLYLPLNVQANVWAIEETINTTVGSWFTLNPWGDMSSSWGIPGLSQFSCASTFCKVEDVSAFTANVLSTTTTRYPYYNNTRRDGFYNRYSVQALKAGIYIINAGATCYKEISGIPPGLYVADPRVIYHVIVTEKPIVTSISIPSSLTMIVGDSYTFSPVITQSGASTTLLWNSSNANTVSVTNGGEIKALTCGSSVITCTASNGVSAQCVVTVNPILGSSISLNHQELELEEGKRITLEAAILPANSTNKEVKWSSSNDNVAFVGANGLVIGVSPGYCNITATTTDGSNKSANCIVHIYKLNLIESISFENSSIEIIQGESVILKPVIYPADVSNKVLTWTSGNQSCASVNNDGIVTGLSEGIATIIASTTDGTNLSASCRIVIKRNKYEIVYLMDGEVYKKDSCLYGQEIIVPEVLSKEGYTFNGWSNVPSTMPAKDLTITGSYEVNYYELTYMVDGDIYKTVSTAFGSSINPIEAPEKIGFTFGGWNNLPQTMPAYDVTVDAVFEIATGINNVSSERKYTIYDLRGVELAESISIEDFKKKFPNGIYIIEGEKIYLRK